MSITLSVIVPVYNVAAYLPECIDSILKQTFEDFELLLINDGSTDQSGALCDYFSKQDHRVKVFHKENGGLSDARNFGIQIACGRYLSFIDSDDYLVPNAFELLLREMIDNNLDIIAGYARTIFEDGHQGQPMRKRSFPNRVYDGPEFLCQSIRDGAMSMCAVVNVYRTNLLHEGKLFFKKGILHEDEEWTPRVFLQAHKVKYINVEFYIYRMRENSITHMKDNTKNGIDIINTCYEMEKLYERIPNSKQRMILYDYLVTIFLSGIFIGRLNRKEYEGLIRTNFVVGKSLSIRNKLKCFLFLMNMNLYISLNRLIK